MQQTTTTYNRHLISLFFLACEVYLERTVHTFNTLRRSDLQLYECNTFQSYVRGFGSWPCNTQISQCIQDLFTSISECSYCRVFYNGKGGKGAMHILIVLRDVYIIYRGNDFPFGRQHNKVIKRVRLYYCIGCSVSL